MVGAAPPAVGGRGTTSRIQALDQSFRERYIGGVVSSRASREGWILAGVVDGAAAAPGPFEDVAGVPHLLRTPLELALAGCERIAVVWQGDALPPDIEPLASDSRLASRARLELVTAPPEAGESETILLARADRNFHRDIPKFLSRAIASDPRPVAEIAGDDYDSVFAAEREVAVRLALAAARPSGLDAELAELRAADQVSQADPPWLGFSLAAPDRAGVRRAEKQLVRSLKKTADGYAARVFNRYISLFFTRFLMRTSVHPNAMTVCAFAAAFSGGIVIAQGGYWMGVIGMLLVESGSILDGVDGELARLKCRFSKLGQWMDTVTDDISNVCYWTGCMLSLREMGVEWAFPVWLVAVCAFVITQTTQYFLIAVVYKSGDLAAIPWAFQSTEFLSSRPTGVWPRLKAGLPKFFKRDFAVTAFVVCAFAGRLDIVLLVSAAAAVGFFFAFIIQFARSRSQKAPAEPIGSGSASQPR